MRITSILLALFLSANPAAALADSKDNNQQFRVVEWSDLIPKDWKRPIILPAPPANGEHHAAVDTASLQQDLEGQQIELAGFMIPIKFEQNVVSELLFVPFLQRHTTSHMHHDPNQMLYVYLEKPVPVQNPYIAVTVKGTVEIDSVDTDEGPTGYVITGGTLEDYVY